MNTAYLLLGSNLGDRKRILSDARQSINSQIGELVDCSQLYESEAWGFTSDNFINQVVEIKTELTPLQILHKLHNIEQAAGRVRNGLGYQARTLDIDILFYNDLVLITEDLIVPHPRLHERRFTLAPLCEIAPNFIHPVLKLSIRQLTEQCTDTAKVWIYKT